MSMCRINQVLNYPNFTINCHFNQNITIAIIISSQAYLLQFLSGPLPMTEGPKEFFSFSYIFIFFRMILDVSITVVVGSNFVSNFKSSFTAQSTRLFATLPSAPATTGITCTFFRLLSRLISFLRSWGFLTFSSLMET